VHPASGLPTALQHKQEEGEIHDALDLVEEFAACLLFADHTAFLNLVHSCWETESAKLELVKKLAYRKVRGLEADSKSDPDVVAKATAVRADAGRLAARAAINLRRLSIKVEQAATASSAATAEEQAPRDLAAEFVSSGGQADLPATADVLTLPVAEV
jgi:hypothetical protein